MEGEESTVTSIVWVEHYSGILGKGVSRVKMMPLGFYSLHLLGLVVLFGEQDKSRSSSSLPRVFTMLISLNFHSSSTNVYYCFTILQKGKHIQNKEFTQVAQVTNRTAWNRFC